MIRPSLFMIQPALLSPDTFGNPWILSLAGHRAMTKDNVISDWTSICAHGSRRSASHLPLIAVQGTISERIYLRTGIVFSSRLTGTPASCAVNTNMSRILQILIPHFCLPGYHTSRQRVPVALQLAANMMTIAFIVCVCAYWAAIHTPLHAESISVIVTTHMDIYHRASLGAIAGRVNHSQVQRFTLWPLATDVRSPILEATLMGAMLLCVYGLQFPFN